jgi:hypothetical protein
MVPTRIPATAGAPPSISAWALGGTVALDGQHCPQPSAATGVGAAAGATTWRPPRRAGGARQERGRDLGGRPLARHLALLQHDHPVADRERRRPVGDQDHRPAAAGAAQVAQEVGLGGLVERARGLVEDQEARVADQGAGHRDQLPLAEREAGAALVQHGLVALGQALDEVVGAD